MDSLISFKSSSCRRRMAYHHINKFLSKICANFYWNVQHEQTCSVKTLFSPWKEHLYVIDPRYYSQSVILTYYVESRILRGVIACIFNGAPSYCWKTFNEGQQLFLFKNTFYDETTDSTRHDANTSSEEDYEKPFVQRTERPVTTAPPGPIFRLFRSIYVNFMM